MEWYSVSVNFECIFKNLVLSSIFSPDGSESDEEEGNEHGYHRPGGKYGGGGKHGGGKYGGGKDIKGFFGRFGASDNSNNDGK
jgi:hypothetical protein